MLEGAATTVNAGTAGCLVRPPKSAEVAPGE
jgi:hypothetical protein